MSNDKDMRPDQPEQAQPEQAQPEQAQPEQATPEQAQPSAPQPRRFSRRAAGQGGGHGGGPVNIGMGEKAKDFKGTFKRLAGLLADHKLALLVVLIFSIASTVFMVVGPNILGQATTKLFEGVMAEIAGTGGIDFEAIGSILLLMLALYGVSSLFSYIQGYVMSGVSLKITYELRREIDEKVNRMPFRYFDGTNHGEVLSRVTNDVDTVSQTLNQSLTQIITSVTTVIGVLAMMLSISWLMTLVALAIIPISVIFVTFIVKRSQVFFRKQQALLGNVNGQVEEDFAGHNIIRAFNGEERATDEFEENNEKLFTVAWKANFLSGLMMPAMNVVGNVGYVGICVLGGYLAANGRLTVGNIQAFVQYIRNFTQPLMQLANASNVMQQTAAAAERVFEFLSEDEEVPETDNPADMEHARGEVAFEHVSFGYDSTKPIIKDFSMEAHEGQKIAIVGPTGAGKTTIVKLLMRFYDVDGGSIKVDGVDLRDMRRDDLRALFGMVLQDTWLYNETIMENIRYGRMDATDEEVIQAAKAAHADHFIRGLPDSYQLVLNEDATNISQGQKQLLTIARAILADNKMLILDEATSSVDTRTEILIQRAMDELMKGRTSFVIAHRLSTIRNADVILVMRDGDIVEQGSHDELLARGGAYAELYNAQFAQAAS